MSFTTPDRERDRSQILLDWRIVCLLVCLPMAALRPKPDPLGRWRWAALAAHLLPPLSFIWGWMRSGVL